MSSHRLDIQYPLHAAADEVVLILILFCADDPRDPFLDLRIQPSPLSVHQGDITGTWGGVNALGVTLGARHGTTCRACARARQQLQEQERAALPVEGHTTAPRFVRAVRLALDSEPPPPPVQHPFAIGGTGCRTEPLATHQNTRRVVLSSVARHTCLPTNRPDSHQPALNLGIAQPAYPPPLGRIEGRMVAGWDGGGAHDAPVRSASLVLEKTVSENRCRAGVEKSVTGDYPFVYSVGRDEKRGALLCTCLFTSVVVGEHCRQMIQGPQVRCGALALLLLPWAH